MKTATIRNKESVPINRVAARVLSNGIHYEYNGCQEKIFISKPFCYPPPVGCQNLIGTKRGKITIIGYYGNTKKGDINNQHWVARCSCGRYLLRKGDKWRRGLREGKTDHGCPFCNRTEFLKRHAEYLQYGKNYERASSAESQPAIIQQAAL